MYKLIYFIGLLVRQFVLPNPFTPFGENEELINLIVGGVLIPLSYVMVGLIYDKGSNPTLGSILFTLMYAINTGVAYLVCLLYPTIWLMIIVSIIYFTLYLFVAVRIKGV